MEEAKKIALKDAKLDELTQKIMFTREELNRNQGKPCYLLEFYTGTNQYFYQIDAKSGSIIYAGKFITLSEAKKIALDDAGCKDKVSFTEETLVSGGIKTPYYRLVLPMQKQSGHTALIGAGHCVGEATERNRDNGLHLFGGGEGDRLEGCRT